MQVRALLGLQQSGLRPAAVAGAGRLCAADCGEPAPYIGSARAPQELGGELGSHLLKAAISVERALRVTYMPQAVRWGGYWGCTGTCASGPSRL